MSEGTLRNTEANPDRRAQISEPEVARRREGAALFPRRERRRAISRIPLIEHEVDDDSGHRNIHPDGEREASNFLMLNPVLLIRMPKSF